jgi:eukaryotic-like serine/threonine-protein kinase
MSWSSDGRYIAYEEQDPKTKSDLWILPLDERKPFKFLSTPFNETQGQFSPDGRWIAYVSDQSGRQEVYVRSYPADGSEWQVSTNQGLQPRWREDGKELFFLGSEGTEDFMAVSIDARPSDRVLKIGEPRKLFQFDVISQNQRNSYDVLSGQRFVLNLIPRATGAPPIITAITNWTAGLNRNQ